MRKHCFFSVLCALVAGTIQPAIAQFSNLYIHTLSDDHIALDKSINGTYFIQASTIQGATRDIHLMKLDAQGNVLLDEIFYSPTGDEVALDVCRGNNDTYIICGYEKIGGLDLGFIMQVDTNFVFLNKINIQVTANDRHTPSLNVINSAYYDQPAFGQYFPGDTNGGYLVTGFEAEGYNPTDSKSGYAIKLSDALSIQWAVKFDSPISNGDPDWDMCSSANWMWAGANTGYAIGGSGTSANNEQVCLVATIDVTGNVVWSKLYSDANAPGSHSVVADGAFDDVPLELYHLTNHSSVLGTGVVTFAQSNGAVNAARTSYLMTPSTGYYGFEFGATCASSVILISGYGLNQTDGNTTGTFPFTVRYDKNNPLVDTFGPHYAYPRQSSNYNPNTEIFDTYETGGQPRIYYPKLFGQLFVNQITLATVEDDGPLSENHIIQPFFDGKDSCRFIDPQMVASPMTIFEWPVNNQPASYQTPGAPFSQIPLNQVVQSCLTCNVDVGFSITPGPNCTYTLAADNPGNCPSFMIFDIANTLLFSGPVSTLNFTFPLNGVYTIVYSDCAPDGMGGFCRDQATQTINVVCPSPCPLDADFGFSVNGCCVQFFDLSPEGNPNGCEHWVFGNVASVMAGDNVSFCFPGSGTYTVCHVDCCVDANGVPTYHQVCKQVSVNCAPPCCLPTAINVTPSGCCITVSAVIPGGPCGALMNYVWDFGDGNLGFGQSATHCYSGGGIYTVCLTAYCSKFQKVQFCKKVKVACGINPPPPPGGGGGGSGTARISFNRSGTNFKFSSAVWSSSDWIHTWDFGDGEFSNDLNPVHTYAVSGAYTVVHTVEGVNSITGQPFVETHSQEVICVLASACGCEPPEVGVFAGRPVACQSENSISLHVIDLDSESDIEHQWMRSTCGGPGCPVETFEVIPGAIGQQVWIDGVHSDSYFRCRSRSRTLGFVRWSEEVEVRYGYFDATLTPSSYTACPGQPITLMATPTGAAEYEWSPSAENASSAVVTAVSNATYSVLVTSDLECASQSMATINVQSCPPPTNDNRGAAKNLAAYTLGLCIGYQGTLTHATPSPQSQSTTVTGEDVWYRFTANSPGIRIEVINPEADVVIELQDAVGNVLAVENAVYGVGAEILNYYNVSQPLISGQQYFISVRNYNSAFGSGAFSICIQRIRASGCDSGVGPYATCSNFKAVHVGAQSYDFVFSNTQSFEEVTMSTTAGLTVVPIGGLIPGQSYHVAIYANYVLTNGLGEATMVSIANSSACTITLSPHAAVELREEDRCETTTRAPNAMVAANRWICGASHYQWRFRKILPTADLEFGSPISSPPVNRYINLAPISLLPGATYHVEVRPVFSGGFAGNWSPVPRCLRITGPMSMEWLDENTETETSGSGIDLYPNPNTGDRLVLRYNGFDTDDAWVGVLDATGRVIHQSHIVISGDGIGEVVFERELSVGMYMVECLIDGRLTIYRLMVQH